MSEDRRERCDWVGAHPLYLAYHDEEWGVPSFDDRHLFEHLVLEGAQAGLSWLTILKRREGYRRAFAGFDAARVARFNSRSVERLLADPGIIRNRAKVHSAIGNAKRFLEVRAEFGTFSRYVWSFVGGKPPAPARYAAWKQIPTESEASRALSSDLKERGFNFVGPTIMYAYMQAVGMVNDHTEKCFRRREVAALAKRLRSS
jgi:DNA-3-methyladenine glycosylase I